MSLLRDYWRPPPPPPPPRTAFAKFFDGLKPVDRATFWIAVVLALAIGLLFSALVSASQNTIDDDFDCIDPALIRTADARP